MRAFDFRRCVLSFSLLAASLCACGGGPSIPVAVGNTFEDATGTKHHQTFSYTGAKQTFIVPTGVTRLTVVARGGEGRGSFVHGAGTPGFPGRIYAVIRVHSGDKLYVFVAGSGSDGGFNGGGAGGYYSSRGGGSGGGASDVRVGGDKLKDRIIVAAGGGAAGGCSLYCYADGGAGGGLSGESGYGGSGISGAAGAGGTQSAGGLGGAGGTGRQSSESGQPGGNGALGLGGNGGKGGQRGHSYQAGIGGGGGGGGYYGGGGGGGSASAPYSTYPGSGGGGGGSSYVEPSAIKSRMWTGWEAIGKGDGQVIFSWK